MGRCFTALELLDNPQGTYKHGNEHVRSILNKAFLTKLYVDGRKITGHELQEPFDILVEASGAVQGHDSGTTYYRRSAA